MVTDFLTKQLTDGTKCKGCGQYTNGGQKGPGWVIYCIWCLIYREETGQPITRGSDARKLKKYKSEARLATKLDQRRPEPPSQKG